MIVYIQLSRFLMLIFLHLMIKAFKIVDSDRAITAATINLCGDLSKRDERVKLVARLKALFN